MDSFHRNHKNANQEKAERPTGMLDGGHRRTSNSEIALLGILILVVSGLVLAVHWPVLSAQATSLDDHQYLTENKLVQNPSWSSATRFLTEVLRPSTVKGYYQPLTMISLMLDYAVAGQATDLRPYHQTSLCLHIINTTLVIVLLYTMFGQVWVAAMVGLLFGIHPLCVEAITWVGERKTLLATFFVLLSLICYVSYARRRGWVPYLICFIAFALALLSKPTSIPLPLLLLLLDYWPLSRLNWRTLPEKVPFFIVGAVSAVITFISQTRAAWTVLPTKFPPTAVPLVICHNIRFYLNKILWPVNLSPHYTVPKPLALSNPTVFAGLITTCVVIVVLLLSLRHTRALLIGFLFFFVAILPTMQVIGFTYTIVANRYLYLPSFGLLLPLAWFLSRLLTTASGISRQTVRKFALAAVMTLLCIGEAAATRSYLANWKDTETLYHYMVAKDPYAPLLRIGLSQGLIEAGKIDEAIKVCRQELQINPDHYQALNNLATALAQKGMTEEAIRHLRRAVEVKPDDFKSRYNLGILLSKERRFEQAIVHFRKAVQIRPYDANTHYNLGSVLSYCGYIDEAIREYRAALEINPDFAQARAGLDAAIAKKSAAPPRVRPE